MPWYFFLQMAGSRGSRLVKMALEILKDQNGKGITESNNTGSVCPDTEIIADQAEDDTG